MEFFKSDMFTDSRFKFLLARLLGKKMTCYDSFGSITGYRYRGRVYFLEGREK